MASTRPYLLIYTSESLTTSLGYVVVDDMTINATAPQDFFDTYSPTQNTSSFNLVYVPPNGIGASVSFSLEYFGM